MERNERSSTVLVVDDNPSKRYSISRILRAAGLGVVEAASGQEALDKAEHSPDAIVLDVNLPDIDGFEVCRQMRMREKTSRTPIIHLSATFVEAGDKVHGLDSGADGYLTHPVEPQVLVATVNAFLRARTAEEGLRRSEEKFRAIFDKALNGIALIDADMNYVEANAAMSRILGLPVADIVGKRWSQFLPADFAGQGEEVRQALEAQGEWTGMLPLQRADGGLVYLDWNISLHSIPGVRVAIVNDISLQRQAEAEREQSHVSERAARAEAERANRLKDQFLATISHELRSPLQSILGWSQLLKLRNPDDVAVYRSGIEVIDRNAKAQSQLISDLLDVSRITSGKLRLEMHELDLASEIGHAIENIGAAAEAKGVHVTSGHESGDIKLAGDRGRIQQVLNNLLTNAVKFTPAGGHVRVTTRRCDATVEIDVSDDGKGVDPEFLPYIFDTFRQEDGASTRHHEGLGLGLAIVKRLVEMHGGSVMAESGGESLGTTFRVRFPIAQYDGAAADSVDHAQRPRMGSTADALRGLRILIVDDDEDARSFVKRLLVNYAAVPIEASSAAEAMERINDGDLQLIVSDISMPGQDGHELMRRVREAGFTPENLPAIALTAFANAGDKQRVRESGFQMHLPKPIDLEVLLTAIANLAPKRTA